jgi:hypothetical protein
MRQGKSGRVKEARRGKREKLTRDAEALGTEGDDGPAGRGDGFEKRWETVRTRARRGMSVGAVERRSFRREAEGDERSGLDGAPWEAAVKPAWKRRRDIDPQKKESERHERNGGSGEEFPIAHEVSSAFVDLILKEAGNSALRGPDGGACNERDPESAQSSPDLRGRHALSGGVPRPGGKRLERTAVEMGMLQKLSRGKRDSRTREALDIG